MKQPLPPSVCPKHLGQFLPQEIREQSPARVAWALQTRAAAQRWAAVVAEQRAWVRRPVWATAESAALRQLLSSRRPVRAPVLGPVRTVLPVPVQSDDFRFQFTEPEGSSSMRPLACTARTISQTARAMGIPSTTKTMTGIISIKFPFSRGTTWLNAVCASARGLGKQEQPDPADRGRIGGTRQTPICFHTATIMPGARPVN